MSRTDTSRNGRRQRTLARREITRAIRQAGSPNVRDELIVIAQRGGLI